MRFAIFVAIGIGAVASGANAEPAWRVFKEEVAVLNFGEPENALISIICGRDEETGEDQTWITVAVEHGTKPTQDAVVLIVHKEGGPKELPLKANICANNECSGGADGEVYLYDTVFPEKRPALEIAEEAVQLSIDAPGAKISAPADAKKFAEFAELCRNW